MIQTRDRLTYLSLCGLLGYGYPRVSLEAGLQHDLAFIGVDAGSSDPGPYYLGSGTSFVKEMQVRRDLEPALVAAVRRKIPLIVGTAGGSGARPHVDAFVALVRELASANDLTFSMAVIYSDLDRTYLRQALDAGRIAPCGHQHPLTDRAVETVCNPVAQLGTEPLIEALDEGADVVVAGRCCDTAIFAALPIARGLDPGLALHCAKIAECGALCARPAGANDSLLCRLDADGFEVEPLNPSRSCTPASVAAHSLYEQPQPDRFFEPEGMVDLRGCTFEPVDDRIVRVTGSRLQPAFDRTLKLEGAVQRGYRAVTIAGMADPAAIKAIDLLEAGVRQAVDANLEGLAGRDTYRLIFRRYGIDAVTFAAAKSARSPAEIGLVIEVVAETQELADSVLALARSTALHQSFPGRKATAGNLAFPFSPSDLSAGPVYEFALYHLLRLLDGERPWKTHYEIVGGNQR
jgi:hypothetical protein